MVLNNKGQVFFYTMMLAVVVVVLALALAFPIKQTVDVARGNTTTETVGLDCANSSISDFQKSQCVLTDLATPYFVWGLLGLAGAIVGAKILWESL